MSNRTADDWKNLFQEWQTQQINSTQEMFNAFEHWQKSFTAPPSEKDSSTKQEAADLYASMQAMSESNQALFDAIAKEYEKTIADNTQQLLFKSLSDMTQPQNWFDLSGKFFSMGDQKLSEKPFLSGISDFEEKLAYINDSWQTLLKENQQFHSVVMQSWVNAYDKFVTMVKEQQSSDDSKVFSPRELIDLWTNIANEELMGLHRSEQFLSAQKEVIKASMEYRLHEKNIAEILCESMHIPTRDEVDELHQSVTELKRELRRTKQRLEQYEKQATKKPAKKTNTKKKTSPKSSNS